ncbi:MAG: chemotaxis response regulator protein-glutamate methylesterase [Granulosicoccus sp.]|nr:chemotaxis response regulator protein-glutamate methylesterase [Granulosicoccus sp.]
MNQSQVKVLIVDDSKAFCRFLERVLSVDPQIHVLGYALDAFQARDMIKQYNPDVLTLDVEMPRMDGLTFLTNLMRLRPMPVVMMSSLTAAGADVTLDALERGAVDFMVKRHPGGDGELELYTNEIVKRVKQAAFTKISHSQGNSRQKPLPDVTDLRRKLRNGQPVNDELSRVVAIGSSTGGPEALRKVLTGLEASRCALLFAQHMPGRYMAPFAERLNSWSSFDIRIAQDNEKILPGRGYVAPGDQHLKIYRSADHLLCRVEQSAEQSGHRPSVDVLFESVAKHVGSAGVGLLLTGMGEDGACGLKQMRSAGAMTVVQDEKSSAVWGMPGRAYEIGGADGSINLTQISASLSTLLRDAA